MNSLTEVHESAMSLVTEAQSMVETARNEKRSLTDDESTRFDALMNEAEEKREDAERLKRDAEREKSVLSLGERLGEVTEFLAKRNAPPPIQVEDSPGADTSESPWFAFRKWMLTGERSDGVQTDRLRFENLLPLTETDYTGLLGEFPSQIRGLAEPTLVLPANRMPMRGTRQVVATNTDAAGGSLVQETLASWIETEMKSFNGARQTRATVIRTAKGNDYIIPTANPWSHSTAALTASIIAQPSGAAAEGEIDFDEVILKSYTFASPKMPVRGEALRDAEYDVARWLLRTLGESISRKQASDFCTGAGTAGPEGYVTGSGEGLAMGDTTTTITYENLVDLVASVDPAYVGHGRPEGGATGEFTMNRSTMAVLQKLTGIGGAAYDTTNTVTVSVSDARPLWSMGDIRTGAPPTILGYPVVIDQNMASLGAAGSDAKPIAFGDFSKFIIRDVASMEILRDPYSEGQKYQTLFTVFMFSDSRVLDAGTNPLVHMKQGA